MRSVAGKSMRHKRVDLATQGESDSVIPHDEPHGGPSHQICEIYPEKFEGAAGASSNALFQEKARKLVVEYFPQKEVQDYVSGEVDELIYKEPLEPHPSQREVPLLKPQAY